MLRQKAILTMFGRSPIRPLQRHMEKARACVGLLQPFIEAVFNQDWKKAREYQQEIATFERQADELKRDIRTHLPKGLFLPVPRGDLLELLSEQEMLANVAKDIAGLIIGRQMIIPDAISASFKQYLERCIAASEQAEKAINELDELLETGFGGKEVSLVETFVQQLDKIESQTMRSD